MVEFKLLRGSELVEIKPDSSRPNPYFRTPAERRDIIVAKLNKEGTQGWRFVENHRDFWPGEQSMLMVKEKTSDIYEYKYVRYADLRPLRDGLKVFNTDTQLVEYIKILKQLYDDGWLPIMAEQSAMLNEAGRPIVDANEIYTLFMRRIPRGKGGKIEA
jgi:hypothetical protein